MASISTPQQPQSQTEVIIVFDATFTQIDLVLPSIPLAATMIIIIAELDNIFKDLLVTTLLQTTTTIITRIGLKYVFDNEIFYKNTYDCQSQYTITITTPFSTPQTIIILNEMNNVRIEIDVFKGIFNVCLCENNNDNEIVSGMFDLY